MSESKLLSALMAAQSKMRNPHFDAKNPHFNSQYASLAQVRDVVLPVLRDHGLLYVEEPVAADGMAGVAWRIEHVGSGECRTGQLLLPLPANPNAHAIGSAITYARRYSLLTVGGVVADDDDDGNEASRPSGNATPAARPTPAPPAAADETAEKAAFGAKLTELKGSFDRAGRSAEWAEIRKTRLLWPFPGTLADLQALVKELEAMLEPSDAPSAPATSSEVQLAVKQHKARISLLKRSWLQACGNNQQKRDEEWAAWADKEGANLDDEKSEDHMILAVYVSKMERGLAAKKEAKK